MPAFNLVVIRAEDLDRSAEFYFLLGVGLIRHKHGGGPEHYTSGKAPVIFEIYPRGAGESTAATRIGFAVESLDAVIDALGRSGARILEEPAQSEWGYRAVVVDPDGHKVELLELPADEPASG